MISPVASPLYALAMLAAVVAAALSGEAEANPATLDATTLPLCSGTTTATLADGTIETRAFEALLEVSALDVWIVRGDIDRFARRYQRDYEAGRARPEAVVYKATNGRAFLYGGTNRAQFVHQHAQPDGDFRIEVTESTCMIETHRVIFPYAGLLPRVPSQRSPSSAADRPPHPAEEPEP